MKLSKTPLTLAAILYLAILAPLFSDARSNPQDESAPKLAFKLEGGGSIAFSRDGSYIATGGSEDWLGPSNIKLWSAHTGKLLKSSHIEGVMISAVAFSPDSSKLAVVGYDDEEDHFILDVRTWKRRRTLKDSVLSSTVRYSADGKYIAAAGGSYEDGDADPATIWDAASGKSIRSLPRSEGILDIFYTADGKLLVGAGEGGIKFWNAASGKLLAAAHLPGACCLAISPDGTTVAVGCSRWNSELDGGVIALFDVETMKLIRSFKHESGITSITYSPSGKERVSADDRGLIRISDAASGKVVRQWHAVPDKQGETTDLSDLTYSSDGKRLAATTGPEALVWDLK